MDCASPIVWTAFTWEAFATLATGVLAVGAAFYVGHRQTTISDQQRKILAKQVDLDAFRLRNELFEKRFALYEETRKYLSAIVRDAAPPPGEHQNSYLGTVDKAKFLFRPSVHTDLNEIWMKSQRFFYLKRQYDRAVAGGRLIDQGGIDEEADLLNWLFERLGMLTEIFGDEIKLGETLAT